MTEEQSIIFAKFLITYQDVFSKSDFDMGLFNGDIEHKIDTGNATPIKQKRWRTPKCFEDEEKNCTQHQRISRKSIFFRNDRVHFSDVGNDYLLEDFRLKIKQNVLC